MITITETSIENEKKDIIEKGKKKLYLVLKKKKSFGEEIVEELEKEINNRLAAYIKKKLAKLMEIKPDNPENFLKNFLLTSYIKILKALIEKYNIQLTEKDIKILSDIKNCDIDEDGNKDDKEKNDIKTNEINKNNI
jgi:ribosomal protein S17E